jgi:hypothetical protein
MTTCIPRAWIVTTVGRVLVLSFTAALNPTLVAATTVMLLLDRPKLLMLGYLLGALMTSITLGLVIVFALKGNSTVSTTQNTINPSVDIALGALALIAALALNSGRPERTIERRREAKADKQPPRWQRELSRGSPRMTFAVGALLTLPGASYLAGLTEISKQHFSTAGTVVTVVGFNLIMLLLLELPLVCFFVAPDWTPGAIERAKAWGRLHGLRLGIRALIVLGCALIIKGVAGLISG